jgi:dTDP-4-amino-4,6-dideoxygalactose transaminase
MNVPLFDLHAQSSALEDAIVQRLRQVCRDGCFILGPLVEEFEAAFAEYCDCRFCVAVNSGTSALHLALACLEIGQGDEVITTPMTFVATAWAISYVGATPVFADIDPVTRTLDPVQVAAAVSKRTKAILPVHLYGHPAEMAPLRAIAADHQLHLIEDGAQAHGARYRAQRAGSLSDVGCFSFYPSKNLGAMGEGGALVTNDRQVAERARALRNHAQGRRRNQHDELGFNYRMDAFQAAVLLEKLPYLDAWNARRRQHAEAYARKLQPGPQLRLPSTAAGCEPVYHLYVVESTERERLAADLKTVGIATGLHYPTPVHLQPAYRHLGYSAGSLPHAEALANRCLSLPMFPELTTSQIDYVSQQVNRLSRADVRSIATVAPPLASIPPVASLPDSCLGAN